MSTPAKDIDTTPTASSFSPALPELPTPGRPLLSVKSTEYTHARHTLNPTSRPESTASEIVIPATESSIQAKSHDASRLSVGSGTTRAPRPERIGIGADPERRFSIRSLQISTFDEGGRYAAAGSSRPPPMISPERHSTMDTYAHGRLADVAGSHGSRSRAVSRVVADGDGFGGGGSGVGWIVPVDFEKTKPTSI